jgi:hypothetical protein
VAVQAGRGPGGGTRQQGCDVSSAPSSTRYHIVYNLDKSVRYPKILDIVISRYRTKIKDDIKGFAFDIAVSQYFTKISHPKKNFDIKVAKDSKKSPEIEYRAYISKFSLRYRNQKFNIESGKEPCFGASSISYTLSMPIYDFKFQNRTKCSAPRPPSKDINKDNEMDFDDLRGYMDQDIPARQFTITEFGPLAQLKCQIRIIIIK